MVAAAEGREAFDALFVGHFPSVLRTVAYVAGDRGVAEEIAQDAFVHLLRNWDTVSRYERPDLWVRRVAVRDAQRERRRTWRRPVVEASAAVPAPGPEQLELDVVAAVSALPAKQRAIVVLFYYEDRPMAEIAAIVGCAVSTGWSQLHHARKRLSQALAEEVSGDVR